MYVFIGLAAIYILQIVFHNIQVYVNKMDSIRLIRYIKRVIMWHKCKVSYKYIENYDDFQKRIGITEEFGGRHVAESIQNIIGILQSTLSLVLISSVLWTVNPTIVLVLFITSIPATVLAFLQQDETIRGRAKWFQEGQLAIDYYSLLSGKKSFDALQEIKHFALFDYLKARWRTIADEYIGKKNKIMSKHVKYNTIADLLRSVVYIAVLLTTAWSIYQNPVIGLGTFTLVFTLSGQLQSATGECLNNIIILVQNIPYMQEFFYLDNLEHEFYDNNLVMDNGDINFKNVTFTYPNTENPVLKNLTVNIHDGEKIAVVGENGSGKSTFISLLCGMFSPQKGLVTVGGYPVNENLGIRDFISVVFQDFAHYESTLRDNITISDRSCSVNDSEIITMLKNINVSDVVIEQPNGLYESVGSFSDKANDLSRGQWQKISIARAAYRKGAKIMILDEPTSALDPISEAQLYKDFTKLTQNKTTILISHRLGITAVVDRILVFKDGQIIEDGSHKQLMDLNGHYAQMYKAQAQWYA